MTLSAIKVAYVLTGVFMIAWMTFFGLLPLWLIAKMVENL